MENKKILQLQLRPLQLHLQFFNRRQIKYSLPMRNFYTGMEEKKNREFAASEGRLRVLVANNAIRDCGWVEIWTHDWTLQCVALRSLRMRATSACSPHSVTMPFVHRYYSEYQRQGAMEEREQTIISCHRSWGDCVMHISVVPVLHTWLTLPKWREFLHYRDAKDFGGPETLARGLGHGLLYASPPHRTVHDLRCPARDLKSTQICLQIVDPPPPRSLRTT